MNGRRLTLAGAGVACALGLAPRSLPQATDIHIGMSAALSGPASALGNGMRRGIESQLREINSAGGIGGRQVRLIALDDAYQPQAAAENTRTLIEQHRVLAVVGNVGTPTAVAASPIAIASRTLFFGAFTGAGQLRATPPERYVINFRASYAEETATMVRGLLRRGIRAQEIAFFTQDDTYGESGYEGAVRALEATGFAGARALAHGRYARNTLDVEDGLVAVVDAKVRPRAVIMVGAYAASARFITLARRALPDALFLNVSFVGSDALAAALGPAGEGVIITQVVPHFDAPLPAVRAYRAALQRHFPTARPDFVSLEGFLVARTLLSGLRAAGAGATRDGLVDAIESLGEFDAGLGSRLSFSKTDHQASDRVWATEIRGGRLVPIDW